MARWKGCSIRIAIDITEQKRIETELNKEREILAVTLSGIDNGVITCDTIGKILLMNAAAQLLLVLTRMNQSGNLSTK
jgi:PAS domain-containing protein